MRDFEISAKVFLSDQRYTPYGMPRVLGGTLPSQYTFTGQRSFMNEMGLMDFSARMYSP